MRTVSRLIQFLVMYLFNGFLCYYYPVIVVLLRRKPSLDKEKCKSVISHVGAVLAGGLTAAMIILKLAKNK